MLCQECTISAYQSVSIGRECIIAERVMMIDFDHGMVEVERPIRAQEPAQPFRALVALGDDDPNGQAGELAKLLLACPRVGRVDIVVRPWHPGLAALQADDFTHISSARWPCALVGQAEANAGHACRIGQLHNT